MWNIEPETVYSKNSDRATVKIDEFHELTVVEVVRSQTADLTKEKLD